MKLLNQSTKYLSFSILIIIGIWGIAFFFNMVEEIKENVDEGLQNYKRQIIFKAQQDTTLLTRIDFDEAFYAIQETDKETALNYIDQFLDTIIYIQLSLDAEPEADPVRMLKTVFEDDGRYYKLKIINPMVEKDDLIERLLWNMIWLYLALIITIIFINNIVFKKLWQPFYSLLTKIKNYQLGLSHEIPKVKTTTSEFIDLQNAINTLLQQNIRVFDLQKQFIGNASHELQTPLAIAINKMELLLETEQLNTHQAKSLTEILEIIERLVKLNKSLLLLTKIENHQFPETQEVNINEIVQNTIDLLSDFIDYKGIHINFTQSSQIIRKLNPNLAEILVTNLIRNAIFHNNINGVIEIHISGRQLSISNTGTKSALETNNIYKRFYKSGPKEKNTGLGLSIVKAITDLYSIHISYSFEDQKHGFLLNF